MFYDPRAKGLNGLLSFSYILDQVESFDRTFIGDLLIVIEKQLSKHSIQKLEKPSLDVTNKDLYILTYLLPATAVVSDKLLNAIKLFRSYQVQSIEMTVVKAESGPLWRMFVNVRRSSSTVQLTHEEVVYIDRVFDSKNSLNSLYEDQAAYETVSQTKKRKLASLYN